MKREYDFSKGRRNPYLRPADWTWSEYLLYGVAALALGMVAGAIMKVIVLLLGS